MYGNGISTTTGSQKDNENTSKCVITILSSNTKAVKKQLFFDRLC